MDVAALHRRRLVRDYPFDPDLMITGDHPVTAHAVAEGLGLPHEDRHIAVGDDLDKAGDQQLSRMVESVNIFARTRPEQKYRLVRALKARGETVAMTGDGINDAPALREADIGVAMGLRGTEVARAAATMVLLDDNFATIVGAIRDGRRIFENLRRAFSYLIAFHTPILLAALVVPLAGFPLLLLPIHLIWLELVVHPTVAVVFEADAAPPDLMRKPPRPPEAGLVVGPRFVRSLARGITLSAAVLALYFVGLSWGAPSEESRGMAIAALLLGQTLLAAVERSPDQPFWRVGLAGNRLLLPVLAAALASLLIAVYWSPLADVLRIAPLSLGDWGIVAVVAVAATLWLEPIKAWRQPGRER
jgi:Ca2+-transporting ATPase